MEENNMVFPIKTKQQEGKISWRNYWHMETIAGRADSSHVQRVRANKSITRPMALLVNSNVYKCLGGQMQRNTKEVVIRNVEHETKERAVWADLIEKTKDYVLYKVTRLSDQKEVGSIKLEGGDMEAHLKLDKKYIKSITADEFEELHDLMATLSKENK